MLKQGNREKSIKLNGMSGYKILFQTLPNA